MDAVNHPTHYNSHASGVECVEIAEWLGFNLGNAFKYTWRAGLKADDPIQDLNKALWYVRRERSLRQMFAGELRDATALIPTKAQECMRMVLTVRGENADALALIYFGSANIHDNLRAAESAILTMISHASGVPEASASMEECPQTQA